jgi:hypothetical protein
MLFFNYTNIYLLARGDSYLIVRYLQEISKGRYKDLIGYNFIVNPKILFNSKYSYRVLAEYVGLCSLRNYSDFKLTKQTNLHISRLPIWVPDIAVKENPLIEINNSFLEFKSEKENI